MALPVKLGMPLRIHSSHTGVLGLPRGIVRRPISRLPLLSKGLDVVCKQHLDLHSISLT